MPALSSRFLLQPQNVPLFIKGLLPSPRANLIILCGVSIGLAVTITCILTRRKERLFRGLGHERWKKNTQDNEKPIQQQRRRRSIRSSSLSSSSSQSSSLWPKTSSTITTIPTTTTISNRVNFKIEPQEEVARTITTSISEIPQQAENLELQRRRSYTNKDTSEMDETSEEIVVAEGWRRHTRVYGGGVCQACLESEERMRAMNLKLQSNAAQETSTSPNQSGGGNLVEQDSKQQQQPN